MPSATRSAALWALCLAFPSAGRSMEALPIVRAKALVGPVFPTQAAPPLDVLKRWDSAFNALNGWMFTHAGTQAREIVAHEAAAAAPDPRLLAATAGPQSLALPPGEEASLQADQERYSSSFYSLWAMYLINGNRALRLGTILPLAIVAAEVDGDVEDLLQRASQVSSLPPSEAEDLLRRLERLRAETAPLLGPGIQRVMDRYIRRSSEPIGDKRALRARISEVNKAVQLLMGLEYYPGVGRFAEEAAAKLEELQSAWVARWGGELKMEGFVLATEGAVFAGETSGGGKIRVGLRPRRPAPRAASPRRRRRQ